MKATKVILVVASVLLLGLVAWSQEYPKVEVGVDYSFVRFAPSSSYTQGHSLNGGGGSLVYNVNSYLGIKADFQGYGSNDNNFSIPPTPAFPLGLSGTVQGNLFTYMFGPQIKVRAKRFQPYGQLLFGGAHSNVYANAFDNLCISTGFCTSSASPASNAFAMAFGGGIDIPINKTVSFRPAEVDYLLTRFQNDFTTGNQSNFRFAAGIVFTFGGSK